MRASIPLTCPRQCPGPWYRPGGFRTAVLALVGVAVLSTIVSRHEPARSQEVSTADALAIRKEIHQVEALLPQLHDRGAALFLLAQDYSSLGDYTRSLDFLTECLKLREGFNPVRDPSFARLRGNLRFETVVKQMIPDRAPVRAARLAFVLAETGFVPEGLASDTRQHVLYIGSLNKKKILQLDARGRQRPFASTGQGVCGLKADVSASGGLWANLCQFDGEGSEVVHFDPNGRITEHYEPPGAAPHLFNDLVLQGSRAIFLTDSLANAVWRLDRSSHVFSRLRFPRDLYYPNGIAITDDNSWLYVSDAFGTLAYNVREGRARELVVRPSIHATAAGFDGLYWHKGELVGIQNALGPAQIATMVLSADGMHIDAARVLEYGSAFVESPTTGALDGSRFFFIANANIAKWREARGVPPHGEPVRVGVLVLSDRE
jgi:hypothetical protein